MEWPGELLGFQQDGVRVLVERPCVLLADDMGLGKTIQAAAAMRILARRGEIESILVVTPAAVVRNWHQELARWAPELRVIKLTGPQAQRAWKWDARVHVKIVSYETLRSDHSRVARRHGSWDLICLDEAQRIKNSLDDVRSILAFLRPEGLMAETCDIASALREVQLRRKKPDVLAELPAKTVTELFVRLSRQQRDEYDAALTGGVDELRAKGAEATVNDVLVLINRPKQVCNFAAGSGRSSKLDDLAPRLAALRQEGHKALVFSQFTNEGHGVRGIARALSAFGPGDLHTRHEPATAPAGGRGFHE